MIPPIRLSPVHSLLQSLPAEWGEVNHMPAVVGGLESNAQPLGIADFSCLSRFGVRGVNAAAWLTSQGIDLPDRPNTWLPLPGGGLVARLGLSEFLIEDSFHSRTAIRLAQACQTPPARVYPVLRQDLAIALGGELVHELLLQTCNINFRSLALSDRPVVLTSLISVAVTVIPGEFDGQPFYRLWCDGTFGVYVWRTLVEIGTELGGSVVDLNRFLEAVPHYQLDIPMNQGRSP